MDSREVVRVWYDSAGVTLSNGVAVAGASGQHGVVPVGPWVHGTVMAPVAAVGVLALPG